MGDISGVSADLVLAEPVVSAVLKENSSAVGVDVGVLVVGPRLAWMKIGVTLPEGPRGSEGDEEEGKNGFDEGILVKRTSRLARATWNGNPPA